MRTERVCAILVPSGRQWLAQRQAATESREVTSETPICSLDSRRKSCASKDTCHQAQHPSGRPQRSKIKNTSPSSPKPSSLQSPAIAVASMSFIREHTDVHKTYVKRGAMPEGAANATRPPAYTWPAKFAANPAMLLLHQGRSSANPPWSIKTHATSSA